MPARIAALLLLLVLGVPAAAQGAVPKNVKRVIADFRNDGRIDPCRHTARTYRATLEEVEADPESYAPDFPIAVQAAREARVEARCEEKAEQEQQAERDREQDEDEERDEEAAGAPSATPTPAPDPAPAPVTPAPTSTPGPVAPALPRADPPAVEPTPSATPSPQATPAPPAPSAPPGTGAGITPGVPPATPNKPDVVLTRLSDNREARLPLGILGGVLAAALLAGATALLMRRFGWGEERLAGLRHACAEASYRTGGTWQNFTDWVRLGR